VRGVSELKVIAWAVDSIRAVLVSTPRQLGYEGSEDGISEVLFPTMGSLWIERTRFGGTVPVNGATCLTEGCSSPAMTTAKEPWVQLLDAVELRVKKYEMRTVKLVKCMGVTEEMVLELESKGVEVEWHRHEDARVEKSAAIVDVDSEERMSLAGRRMCILAPELMARCTA